MFDLSYAYVCKFSYACIFIFAKYISVMSLWGITKYNGRLHEQVSTYEGMMTAMH